MTTMQVLIAMELPTSDQEEWVVELPGVPRVGDRIDLDVDAHPASDEKQEHQWSVYGHVHRVTWRHLHRPYVEVVFESWEHR